MRKTKPTNPLITLDHKRDAYGFAIRPQHLQRYREYANIYKEEEEERSDKWKVFLERVSDEKEGEEKTETSKHKEEDINGIDAHILDGSLNGSQKLGAPEVQEKTHNAQMWSDIRPSLRSIEDMMSVRVKRKGNDVRKGQDASSQKKVQSSDESRVIKGTTDEDSEEEFYDVEKSDPVQDNPSIDSAGTQSTGIVCDGNNSDLSSLWKEELEVLVRGGVPMALRGELWQAFVGVKTRRKENYYQNLLSPESNNGDCIKQEETNENESVKDNVELPEKWKGQIEKDLPRTFPGHPALDEDGRNALRRLLIAYARHNPSVGYCQAMNFFAGLLLLLMPEENAFWTLMAILDDYFDGYFSEEMIECQVDQLVFEDLVRERFPKLVNHLDYLGVQVGWVTGPWFLSIFMNMLPWESVLRVWDVLLFEGNRVMLFRTALALMELYGPALVTTKDAGDAVTLLQSLTGSTFDSSQLVLTACMGYRNVHEARLKELSDKHRPIILAAIEERSNGRKASKKSEGLASKLFSFKQDTRSGFRNESNVGDGHMNGVATHLGSGPDTGGANPDPDPSLEPGLDHREQVIWLKVELCKLLEEKRSSELRAEELETALMEIVKQDNRRQLSARVEELEQEVSELRQALADKQEQESAMIQVLMRVEQEQKVTEDARIFAEQEAALQREAAQVLQEKYERAIASLAEMEKRVVMAESMLEATLQYQSGQVKLHSPRSSPNDSVVRNNMESTEIPPRRISLLGRPFGLRWSDKNKGKPANDEECNDTKNTDEKQNPGVQLNETEVNQDTEKQ